MKDLMNLLESGRLKDFTKMILKNYGLKTRKKLGQNFIVNRRIALRFVNLLSDIEDPILLEIGTGLGTLTYYVAKTNQEKTIITVEKDPQIYSVAKEVLSHLPNVVFVLGDAMDFLEKTNVSTVFSSTPYHLSTDIVLKIARNNEIQRAILGVQKEVGMRLASQPGSKMYGRISVISQLIFNIEIKDVYPPSSFYPIPEVSGVIVAINRKKNYDRTIHGLLEKLTECIFSHRNKLARKILSSCIYKIRMSPASINFENLKITEETRVRDLSPEIIETVVKEYLI